MGLPTLNVTPGTGATVNTLPNAPAVTANSVSVALATDQAAVPITAASLPLPSGAAQDGVDATGVASPSGGVGIRGWLSGIYAKLSGTITVSGTFWPATQPVSIASLPTLSSGSNIIGKIDIDQTTPGTTNGVTMVGGTLTLTDRSGYIRGAVGVATVQAAGGAASHNYAPGDTLTLPIGTGVITAPVLNVATTQVVSATIVAAGTGGTAGTQTVIGTTGTGTKFQASVTVASGAITTVNSISVTGSYTVNPTTPTAEPVTGGGLTGAQLNVVLGVASIGIATAGAYSAQPTNPITPASTSGSGTGVTVNLTVFTPLSTPVFLVNPTRQRLMWRNESTSQNMGMSLGLTAALGTLGTSTFGPSGDGWDESGARIVGNAISLIGGSAFQQFTAWEG